MSGDLIDTTEMYLKAVFELEEANVVPMRARIAERLGHSGPTVSQTVARMERDGLLHLDEDRHIRLSDEGAAIAIDVMRKHRLAERHLLDQIGLDYAHVHEEACRWEHVMSREVEQRIARQISPPYLDPYGNPIPGLTEIGLSSDEIAVTTPGKAETKSFAPLADVLGADGEVRATLRRIGERVQADVGLLSDLARHGIVPEAEITASRVGDDLVLGAPDHDRIVVGRQVATQLTVSPDAAE